jgi:Flp pilus assembly CpaE family ATPase
MTTVQKGPHEGVSAAEELENRLELLRGIAIFFKLPDSDVRRLARKLTKRQVPSGTVVVHQGEAADRMYMIESGRCEVRATWAPQHSVTVALLAAGDFFGISAMKGGAAQPASVTALEATDLLELAAADINAVLQPGSAARLELERFLEQRSATIEHLVGRANATAHGGEGRLIAVYSAKGGSGKTTIAVNLAAALGQTHRGEVVLLDLGLPYNHAALTANLVPTSSLAFHERASDHELEELLLSACILHRTGMMVLPGALKVEHSELITPQLVQRALDALGRTFTHVVVDLGVAMSEMTLSVLERASQVVVIVTPELTAIKDTRELIELFNTVLNIPAENVKLVLNHPRASTMVEREDVERSIGRSVDFELEHDGIRCDRASVTGELLIVSAPTSPLTKKLKTLAASLDHLAVASSPAKANRKENVAG